MILWDVKNYLNENMFANEYTRYELIIKSFMAHKFQINYILFPSNTVTVPHFKDAYNMT